MHIIMSQCPRTERVNASGRKKAMSAEVTHVEWNADDKTRSAQNREMYQYLDNVLF